MSCTGYMSNVPINQSSKINWIIMSVCTILCTERASLILIGSASCGALWAESLTSSLLFHVCFGQAQERFTNVEYHQDAIVYLLVPASDSQLDIIFN